jgi:hypothetical protein
MKIGFHTQTISLRGTEIALYDYAFHNQALLNNKSVIFYKSQSKVDADVLKKFQAHFHVLTYENYAELIQLAEKEKIDLAYFIKSGNRDGDLIDTVPSVVHAVFPTKPAEFHGDRFAFVSQWLAKECSNHAVPFVPHMIARFSAEGDLRAFLGIPAGSTVLGCYGGSDSFNIAFVHRTILNVLNERKDIYFIFMNIASFAQHERLLFLPGSADPDRKSQFINTCDGMIHARGIGETFGLACGEFSIKNKPVLTYAMSPQRSHIEILGDKGIFYRGPRDLKQILLAYTPVIQHTKSWDAYSAAYSPEPVMQQFKSVFLEEGPGYQMSAYDKLMVQGYRFIRKLRNLQKKLYSGTHR